MVRTAPGLLVALVTLLIAAPTVEARSSQPACKGKKSCKAQTKKPAKAKAKAKHGTGWHKGVYDGGPGDPIIAPLPSLPG